MITDGIRFDFVDVHAAGQEHMPERKCKLEAAASLLSKARCSTTPAAMLSGSRPQPAHFPNHASALTNAAFVSAEI